MTIQITTKNWRDRNLGTIKLLKSWVQNKKSIFINFYWVLNLPIFERNFKKNIVVKDFAFFKVSVTNVSFNWN